MHDGCPAGDEKAVTSPLHVLASVHGVATSYVDHAGRTTAVAYDLLDPSRYWVRGAQPRLKPAVSARGT